MTKQSEAAEAIIESGRYQVYNNRLYKFNNDGYWERRNEYDFKTDIAYELQNIFPDQLRQSFINDCCLLVMAILKNESNIQHNNQWLFEENQEDMYYINCKGSILSFDRETGEMTVDNRSPKTLFFSTNVIPHKYIPNSQAPERLFRFFKDCELDHYQIEDILYSYADALLPDLNLSKMLFIYGNGEEGKSVLNGIAESTIGMDNTAHLTLDQLTGENRFALYEAIDKSLVIIDETCPTKKHKTAQLKNIVSGGNVYIESKGVQGQKESLKVKIQITSNHLIGSKDTAHGFLRRFTCVHMKKRVPKHKQDPNLLRPEYWQEIGEAEKIFNFLIPYVQRLIQLKQFPESQHSNQFIEEYSTELNPIRRFLTDNYMETGNKADVLSPNEIFERYCLVCNEERRPTGYLGCFTKELKRVFLDVDQLKSGVMYKNTKRRLLLGITPKEEDDLIQVEQENTINSIYIEQKNTCSGVPKGK